MNISHEQHIQVEESKIDKHATTTFVEDATIAEADYTTKTVVDEMVIRDQTIISFLEKPYLVAQGAWNTTDLANAALFPLGFLSPSALLLSNALWTNKIQGFNLVRGTAVLRIQINANPFQQGKLLMHFLPCATSFGGTGSSYEAMHNINLTTKRMQPCVEIDCRDSVGILKIPYIAPTSFYSISDGRYDWGRVYLSVYAPLQVGGGGSTRVDYSVYLSFEDFEMGAPMVPQAKTSSKSYRAKSYKEMSAASTGPIGNALKMTAKVSNALHDVPVIGPVADTVSWVARGLGGVASFFGWSKPSIVSPPTVITTAYNTAAANSDGVDVSYTLALTKENSVKIIEEASILNEDEMSFNFLKRVSTYITTIDWATDQASGSSLLTAQPIGPNFLRKTGIKVAGTSSVTYTTGPPINYLCSKFNYWRGSIKLVIKIAKTDYHSGRLQITWTPRADAGVTPTLTTGQLALREIIDLRTGNEIEMILPYMLPYGYLLTSQPSGYLDILVLNELRAPETASQTVSLLMHYSGGDDFEFQCPAQRGSFTIPFSPQGNEGGSVVLVKDDIGSQAQTDQTFTESEMCVGEVFTSVKQILNRNSQLFRRVVGTADGYKIWPFFCTAAYLPTNLTITVPNIGGDAYGHIAPMYAFYRGSARIQNTMPVTAVNYPIHMSLDTNVVKGTTFVVDSPTYTLGYESNYAGWGPSSTIMPGFKSVATANTNVGMHAVTVPYYSRTKCSLVLPSVTSDTVPNDVSQPTVMAHFYSAGAFTNGVGIHRSFKDDFQLSYFIGCPPYVENLA